MPNVSEGASPDKTTKHNFEVEECDQRYERIEKLGEGTYGIVYKCRDRETNEGKCPFLYYAFMFQ